MQHPSQGTQRPTPKITVLGEEHHAFPSERKGPATRAPNSTDPNREPSAQRATTTKAQQAYEQSQRKKTDRQMIDSLPPGHPVRERLEQQLQQTTSKPRNQTVSVTVGKRRPTRLELERQRRNLTVDDTAVRSQAEIDPGFMSIGLPSQSKFYTFSTLTVCCLKGMHQAKMARATKDRKMRYVVEAISSTLGEGVSAFDLTPQDFYFLLYWHRLQSFPKNPQMIPFTCTNKEHVRRTLLKPENPEYLAAETLDISTILDATTLKTEYLEELDLSEFQDLIDKYDLHVETMRDLVEFSELQEEEPYYMQTVAETETETEVQSQYGTEQTTATIDDGPSDESFDEVEWLQTRSVFLRRGPGRNTILERNEIVKQMSADEIFQLDKYIEAVTSYGVSESAVLRCKECGASHRVKLSVDAFTFLP
jgi:hypothetical protein